MSLTRLIKQILGFILYLIGVGSLIALLHHCDKPTKIEYIQVQTILDLQKYCPNTIQCGIKVSPCDNLEPQTSVCLQT